MTIYAAFESIYEFLDSANRNAGMYLSDYHVARSIGSDVPIDHYLLLAQPQPDAVLHYLRVYTSTTTTRTSYPDPPDTENSRLRDVRYSNALTEFLHDEGVLVHRGLIHLPASLPHIYTDTNFLDRYLSEHPEMPQPPRPGELPSSASRD